MPMTFKIVELPNEIVYWISSILEEKIVKRVREESHHKSQNPMLENGNNFVKRQELKIDSWNVNPKSEKLISCEHLQQRSGGITLGDL